MPKLKKPVKVPTTDGKPIEQYTHKGKDRTNNPPVGLVTPETDRETGKKMYSYDPHLDPTLVWAGKAEHTSFDVPTVSLHVHERIIRARSSKRYKSATTHNPRRARSLKLKKRIHRCVRLSSSISTDTTGRTG